MSLELTVVDAFAERPFSGNPAAVAVVDAFPDDARMQSVAAEMALSETAFCVARHDGDHDLRWFSPAAEVDLCGHATLATAHVLGGDGRFHTRGGVLSCWSDGDGVIRMDFPSDPPRPAAVPAALQAALAPREVRGFAMCRFDALVELADAAAVRSWRPDLETVAGVGTRGVCVTAPGDRPGVDCVSRFFAPNAGIAEDPVTGSVHCALALCGGRAPDARAWWVSRRRPGAGPSTCDGWVTGSSSAGER